MSAYDDEVGRGAGNTGDDAGLIVAMGELGDCDGCIGGCDRFDEVEESG